MSAVEEHEDSSKRMTARRKFWLFGVGLPALLIGLLVVWLFTPGSLNSTERKLLGKWEIVSEEGQGRIIEFTRDYVSLGGTPYFWSADERSFVLVSVADGEFWGRLCLILGCYVQKDEILLLTDNELEVNSGMRNTHVRLRRIGPPSR